MSNSTTQLDLISSSQAQKEVTANQLFDAASPAMLYGRRASTSAALTFGYYGGVVSIGGTPTQVSNGTVALTASATNYVEADPATGAVSANTTGFTAGRLPLYQVVAGASTVTSYTDLRILGGSASAPVSSVNGQEGDVVLNAADVGADAAGSAAAAVVAHEAAADPHPGYLTQAEADGLYAASGSGSSAVATHEAAADPHPQYLTQTEADARYLQSVGAQPFDLTAFYPGVPTASAIVTRVPVARAVSFPAGLAGSIGLASAAATGSTVFDVQKNGASVGTITFAAGAASATFTAASQIALAAGDTIAVIAPASPDATLSNVGLVLAGSR